MKVSTSPTPNFLDIELLITNIQKHKEGYQQIENKEIVLFLGDTGSGKSTTINYLAGKKMVPKMHKTSFALGGKMYSGDKLVIDCEQPLSGSKIGHTNESETSAIYPHVCEDLLLCDTPGLKDTQGVETEIANAVGIYNALIQAKSVRLVLVLDVASVGHSRGQVFKKFLQQISRFMRDASSHLAVVFTHVKPEEGYIKLFSEILSLADSSQVANDPELQAFVVNLLDHLEKNQHAVVVDPLVPEKREGLLSLIRGITLLASSSDAFSLLLQPDDRSMLVEAVAGMHYVVQAAVAKCEFTSIRKLFSDLKLLSQEISMMPEISDAYSQSILLVEGAIKVLGEKLRTFILSDAASAKVCMGHLVESILLRDYLHVRVEDLYYELKHLINQNYATLFQDVIGDISYPALAQKLGTMNEIQLHLLEYLPEENKTYYERACLHTQQRIMTQDSRISELLELFSRSGNCVLPSTDRYLLSCLTSELDQFGLLGKLDDTGKLYTDKILQLDSLIETYYRHFVDSFSGAYDQQAVYTMKTAFSLLRDLENAHY